MSAILLPIAENLPIGCPNWLRGEVVQPEVFYLICEGMYPDVAAFVDDLEKIAPK